MSCGTGTPGSVISTLSLYSRVGFLPFDELNTSFFPWPNEFWDIILLGNTWENVEVTPDSGDLFFDATLGVQNATLGRYRGVYWISTLVDTEPSFYNLEAGALYFRLLPMINDNTGSFPWITTFQLYDFGEAGTPEPSPPAFAFILVQISSGTPDSIDITSGDGEHDWNTTGIPYDRDTQRWFRVRYEEHTGLVYIETAPEACGSWTVLNISGPFSTRITTFTLEMIQEVFFDENNLPSPGYFGQINQPAVSHSLPLLTRVGDVRAPGVVIAELPLITDVVESSVS